MENSIFLAKVIGLYLLIAGLMLLIRRGAIGGFLAYRGFSG